MTAGFPREVLLTEPRVTLPLDVALPITRGSVEVCVSTARGGPPVHPTLARTLPVADGVPAPFVLFARDLRALFPRGGRVWLVVRYGSQVVTTTDVRLIL